MRYRLPGKSGLGASELCLGTMTLGEERGWCGTWTASSSVPDPA